MSAAEVDFPRGGVPKLSRESHNQSMFGPSKSSKAKLKSRTTAKSTANDGKASTNPKNSKSGDGAKSSGEPNYEGVFRQILSTDLLVEDVRGLALVKEIHETEVILECAEGILLQLPADRISRLFTAALATGNAQDTTLDEVFVVGQAVAFKVIRAAHAEDPNKKTKTKPTVSICPYEVNGHLLPVNLSVPGVVINGIVASVEEKGAVIDLGMASEIKGFVQQEDLPSYLSLPTLRVGQVILFRVKPSQTQASRVVALSGFPEMDTLDDAGVQLNHLMPGTILQAEPEKILPDGVYVGLRNGLKAFVRKIHLPPRIRFDMDKCIKAFRVCVLCCQQNSPLLVLGAHPDVLALAKVEKRVLPEACKVGAKIHCMVYDVDKQQNVYFKLEEEDEDGKSNSLITGKALRIQIDDVDKNISNFSLGSSHLCRVIGYNCVERLLLLSVKSAVLKQKIVAVSEAKPGEKFTASVVFIKPNGLTVRLCGDVFGYITTMHVRNKPSSAWTKGFRKDQKVDVRVLYLDESTNRLILTAKPAMVDSSEKLVTEYDEGMVGDVVVGNVMRILDSGGFLVGFYNRVKGLVMASDAKRAGTTIIVGMPVKVRIKAVDASKRNMLLDFGESEFCLMGMKEMGNNPIVKTCVKRAAKPFRTYTAKVLGAWKYGGTSEDTSAELLLNGGSIGRLHSCELPEEKSKGYTEEGSHPMKAFLSKNKDKTVTVKVICVGKPKHLSMEGKERLMEEHKTTRIVECTMQERKMAEPRKKLKLINYQDTFDYGSRIAAFVVAGSSANPSSVVAGEINPFFKFQIPDQRIGKEAKLPTDNVLEDVPVYEEPMFSSGQLCCGKVVGVNKTKRGKCVELSLVEEEKKQPRKKKLRPSVEDYKEDDHDAVIVPQPFSKRVRSDSTEEEELKPDIKDIELMPLQNASTVSSDRKRKFVKVPEATFDWSTAGFSLEDLAEVGKKTNEHDEKTSEGAQDSNSRKRRRNEHAVLSEMEQNLLGEGVGCELDFDRLVTGNPNSSELWIKYIAFFIAQKNYAKAKSIAERALQIISFREDGELFNVWKVYLNLEVMFGSPESMKDVFARSCASTNSLMMHKHFVKVLKNCSKSEEAGEVYEAMIKKFKNEDIEVWYMYAEHLLEVGEAAKSRELLQRALQCTEKKHHVSLLCRFAQMEYKQGDSQRGKTMFEKVVHTYSKKTIVWTLFLDMVLKYESIVEARKLFERAIAENSTSGKLKIFFKKWMEAEDKFGDEESQNLVRERAVKLVDDLKKDDTEDVE